jgi:hypothetical protein
MEKEWFYGTPDQQLGPVKQSTLVAMARSGKLPPATLVFTEGMPQWVHAGQLPFLYLPGGGPPGGDRNDAGLNILLPIGPQSGFAIASGYVGIISLAPGIALVAGPLAVIFAVLGMRELKRSPQKRGLGRCITGIVCACLGLVFTAMLFMR